MLDYWKIWIYDEQQIIKILGDKRILKEFTSNQEGELTSINGRFTNWTIKTLSPKCLQVTGSIHKYTNDGTNENDFHLNEVIRAINAFCLEFDLSSELAFVKNLEFGVNLQLAINASEIIDQVICYNYVQPIRPYSKVANCYFIEFEQTEYYFKIYDKGKQYRDRLPDVPNTLRMEVKAMKNRLLPRVTTLRDLQRVDRLRLLAVKFATFLKGLVFDDDTIELKDLSSYEQKLYTDLRNPRNWKGFRGQATSGTRKKIQRFKELVERHGKRKIYSTIAKAVEDKLLQLSEPQRFPLFTPNSYTVKTATLRQCKSCGRDIGMQHPGSKFCSAKYVGEESAKKCRNKSSNKALCRRRKIEKVNSRGVLFDIEPYLIEHKNERGDRRA